MDEETFKIGEVVEHLDGTVLGAVVAHEVTAAGRDLYAVERDDGVAQTWLGDYLLPAEVN